MHSMLVAALPVELVLEILSFLSAKELAGSSSVSKRWNQLASSSELWRRLYHCDVEPKGNDEEVAAPAQRHWKEHYRQNVFWKWDGCGCSLDLSSDFKTASLSGQPSILSVYACRRIVQGQRAVFAVRYAATGPPASHQNDELQSGGWTCVGLVPANNVSLPMGTDISCVSWSLWSDGGIRRGPLRGELLRTIKPVGEAEPLASPLVLPKWQDGDVIGLVVDLTPQQEEENGGTLTFLLNNEPILKTTEKPGETLTFSNLLSIDTDFVVAASIFRNGSLAILSPTDVASSLLQTKKKQRCRRNRRNRKKDKRSNGSVNAQ
ncbi:hypothetical protein QOT17_016061 [Balamuthia mandrillaris]